MIKAEPEYTITLRDVGDADLEEVLRLNEASVPAVNSVDLDLMRWFAAHAAYFRVAMRDEALAGFLIGMRPGTSYTSLNYRWFCDAYEDFGYIDRIAISETARRRGLAGRIETRRADMAQLDFEGPHGRSGFSTSLVHRDAEGRWRWGPGLLEPTGRAELHLSCLRRQGSE